MNGTIETKKPTTATNSAGFNTNFLKKFEVNYVTETEKTTSQTLRKSTA